MELQKLDFDTGFQEAPLENKVEVKEKKKKENLWTKIFNKRRLEKKNKVAIVYLRKNNTVELMEVPSVKGFFNINNKTYHEETDCIYTIRKDRIPLAIIEEDGLIPRGNADYYKNLMTLEDVERRCARHQDLALNAIRHAELVRETDRDKPKMSAKAIVGLVIVVIVVIAVWLNYG